ncbi:MAG: hypothetical protein JNL19_09145 [Burkholderiales bacterium]|nr:hypothetical protein [Burkholderiales bacterium]
MSNSTDLAFSAIRALVLYSLAEHQLGHATTIRVTANGNTFSVSDDGRGHAIARTVGAAPYLKFIYNHFDYPFGSDEAAPVQLQGIGMSLINALCSELTVVVRKRDATLRLAFRDGQLCEHRVTDVTSDASETGNTVTGTVRPELAGDGVDVSLLEHGLQQLLRAHPALCIVFNGATLGPATPQTD